MENVFATFATSMEKYGLDDTLAHVPLKMHKSTRGRKLHIQPTCDDLKKTVTPVVEVEADMAVRGVIVCDKCGSLGLLPQAAALNEVARPYLQAAKLAKSARTVQPELTVGHAKAALLALEQIPQHHEVPQQWEQWREHQLADMRQLVEDASEGGRESVLRYAAIRLMRERNWVTPLVAQLALGSACDRSGLMDRLLEEYWLVFETEALKTADLDVAAQAVVECNNSIARFPDRRALDVQQLPEKLSSPCGADETVQQWLEREWWSAYRAALSELTQAWVREVRASIERNDDAPDRYVALTEPDSRWRHFGLDRELRDLLAPFDPVELGNTPGGIVVRVPSLVAEYVQKVFFSRSYRDTRGTARIQDTECLESDTRQAVELAAALVELDGGTSLGDAFAAARALTS